MSDYPEHDRLAKISEVSNDIGAFLDFGLAAQNLFLYERFEEPCTCHECRVHETDRKVGWHCDAAAVRDGVAYYAHYRPTNKSISAILAEHFEIDQDKIDAEKNRMDVANVHLLSGGDVEPEPEA